MAIYEKMALLVKPLVILTGLAFRHKNRKRAFRCLHPNLGQILVPKISMADKQLAELQ